MSAPRQGSSTQPGDVELAAMLAAGAGELLVGVRADNHTLPTAELKDLGDRSAHEYLMAALTHHRPDDCVLSEEGLDSGARVSSDRVWIVDPLDGTREFGDLSRSDWAVHVALWTRGHAGTGSLSAGAVALPARGVVHDSSPSDAGPLSRVAGPLRLAVSRSRPPAVVDRLAARTGATLVPMGSAGVKAMAVLTGEADAYVHAGGQYEWDSAAPVAVASARGLVCTRLDGTPLAYNNADPYLPDLVVAHPDVVEALMDALAGAAPEPSG